MRYFCNAHRPLLCLAGSRRPAGCCRTAGLPAGCAAYEPHSVIVTTANANSSIQLNAGDTLLVQLEGNSGTGLHLGADRTAGGCAAIAGRAAVCAR